MPTEGVGLFSFRVFSGGRTPRPPPGGASPLDPRWVGLVVKATLRDLGSLDVAFTDLGKVTTVSSASLRFEVFVLQTVVGCERL